MSLRLSWIAAAAAALPLFASAQWSGNLALTSNYKFRGQDQDTHRSGALKPAVQGGVDYVLGESGWYLGNWNSSVRWLSGNALEVDLYGGYRFKAAGADWDLGALAYLYPGNRSGNTTELYAAATLGAFTAKYSHTVSKDYFGFAGATAGSGRRGTNTGYFALSLAQEVAPAVTLKASVGFTRFAGDVRALGVPNYLDYQLGASYDLGSGLALAGALAGASERATFGAVNRPRAILTLTKTL